MDVIIISAVTAVVSSAVGFVIANKLNNAKYEIYVETGKSKSKSY